MCTEQQKVPSKTVNVPYWSEFSHKQLSVLIYSSPLFSVMCNLSLLQYVGNRCVYVRTGRPKRVFFSKWGVKHSQPWPQSTTYIAFFIFPPQFSCSGWGAWPSCFGNCSTRPHPNSLQKVFKPRFSKCQVKVHKKPDFQGTAKQFPTSFTFNYR